MINLISKFFRSRKIAKIHKKELELNLKLQMMGYAQIKEEIICKKEALDYKLLQAQLEVKTVNQNALNRLMKNSLDSQIFHQKQLSTILNQINLILNELKVLQDEKKKLYPI